MERLPVEASVELLAAPLLTVPHGFATRRGGVSTGPWAGLNLADGTGDEPEAVERNRDALLARFGAERGGVCLLRQVHGDRVVEAGPGWGEVDADAAVSRDPRLLLAIATADCYPLLFHDPASGAVAAAHCGWRGTVLGLAGRVLDELRARYGSDPGDVRVAIGPGICRRCYQVGEEVRAAFREAGFPAELARPDGETDGGRRWRLDLAGANRWALLRAGARPEHVVVLDACTACDPARFYSHRRDRGVTGRHWSAIRAPERTAR